MIAEKRKIIKCKSTTTSQEYFYSKEEEDWIALEINLKIIINGDELVSFSCSPVGCKDLAIGFLFTEGIISALEEIDYLIFNKKINRIEITLNGKTRFDCTEWNNARTMSSGCGQGVISKLEYRKKNLLPVNFKINTSLKCLSRLSHHLITHSEWYEKTGCIHQVILFNNDGTLIVREDIGRHNAVDKVIGAALQCNINFEETIMNCSGRLSSDMILKAGKARIPIVVSRAAPTSLAVDIADEWGITLIGFARGKKLNIYSHPERINFNEDPSELTTVELSEDELVSINNMFVKNLNYFQEVK